MKKNVLFVCTGNTCRSPMAEHLFRQKARGDFSVQSAGMAAFPGQSASPEVIQLFEQDGQPLRHEAQPVTPELMEWADLIFTMTRSQSEWLKKNFPQHAERTAPLKAGVAAETEDMDIGDPIGGSMDHYQQTKAEIEKCIDQLVSKLGEDCV